MLSRRSFGKVIGATAVAASVAGLDPATATAAPSTSQPGAVKQINAGLLNVGYAEWGPQDGTPVICHHGWPTDIHSFVDAANLLAPQGYRVIAPFTRGYGSTTFRSDRTFRNAQQSVVALDTIALMDALKIDKAILAGFDWGARTVSIIGALWPERTKALVSVGGYVITNLQSNLDPLPPEGEHKWWHQFYFATERGKKGLERNRDALARLMWQQESPNWNFDDATFARTAASLHNDDHVAIVLHNYRWRLSLAKGDPRYDGLERKLAKAPKIDVPTVTLHGLDDPFAAPNDSGYRDKFTGKYKFSALKGIGGKLPMEAPAAFAQAVVDADKL
ncbi:alpha/beta hydrolase [Actinocrispum sp. NPDC049592]|uniref:alpha/beta fold hydrolase n=1 Tax=Actinocrispum sp. NPDC049592 TaxID=3154835 RepID=UPI00341688DD